MRAGEHYWLSWAEAAAWAETEAYGWPRAASVHETIALAPAPPDDA
jgi:hypothetical protein